MVCSCLEAVVRAAPQERLCWGDLAIGPDMVLPAVHINLGTFLRDVVVHCRDVAVRSWRTWILEDPLVHLLALAQACCSTCSLLFFQLWSQCHAWCLV